jgi:hypothetical protein
VKDPEYNEDKWLALREGPGPQFKLITQLGGYEHLEADATKGDWTHISNVTRLSSTERNSPQIVQGWVRSKYVKTFPCENETADEPKSGTKEPPLPPQPYVHRNYEQWKALGCEIRRPDGQPIGYLQPCPEEQK